MTKLTYVSRIHPRDHLNHVILGVVGNKPNNFAAQINLNTTNMWEIVKSIVDLCMKLNEGKYALQVRIYEIPVDAFENDYVEEPIPEDEQLQPTAEGTDGEEEAAAALLQMTWKINKPIDAQPRKVCVSSSSHALFGFTNVIPILTAFICVLLTTFVCVVKMFMGCLMFIDSCILYVHFFLVIMV
jgi:hypothetical protein